MFGSRAQQQQLYLVLVGARAELGNMGLIDLQQPLIELTRFFQLRCAAEANVVDTVLKATAPFIVGNKKKGGGCSA